MSARSSPLHIRIFLSSPGDVADGTARVWDAASGDPLLTLRHERPVYGAAWNGDETRLLTWSADGTARVWDAKDAAQLLTLRHERFVYLAAWNGDETRLLTWSGDTVRAWLVDLDQLIALAESYQLRPLNNDELAQSFLPSLEPTITPTPRSTVTPLPTLTASPVMPTITPLPTLTPSATPTPEPTIPSVTPVRAGAASAGSNRGEIRVGSGQVWIYQGRAGELLTVWVNADRPAGTETDAQTRIERGLLDTYVILRGPDQSSPAEDDDIEADNPEKTNLMVEIQLPVDGTYQIEVRSYADKSGGTYTLVIESSRSAGTAATLTPTPTIAPTATLTPSPAPAYGLWPCTTNGSALNHHCTLMQRVRRIAVM